MKSPDISSLEHTSWRCQYHVVFAPKYRRMEIYREIRADIGVIIRKLCQQKGVEIIEANACPDHIHMLINCTPQHYIPNIIKAMKGVSARLLMKEFGDDLRSKLWGGHLWNPSYFVATVSENTEEQIIEYIRSQKRK